MKVLLINTSEEKDGILEKAMQLCADTLHAKGIETEIIRAADVHPCTSCGKCLKRRRCLYDGIVNEIHDRSDSFDGMIVGTDVIFGDISRQTQNLMRCLFRSCNEKYADKIAASIFYERRGNSADAYSAMNIYYSFACMPVVTGRYLNTVSDMNERDQKEMIALADHMSVLLKGEKKKKDDIPDKLVEFMRGR